MILVGFLDGLGIVLLIPLLSISGILQPAADTGNILFKLLEPLQRLPQASGLLVILGTFIVLLIGQSLVNRSLGLRDVKIHTGFINHTRLELYQSILQANWDFFVKRRKSDLVNALTQELGIVMNATKVFMQFAASFIFAIVQVGIAFWLAPYITMFVIACGLVVLLFSRRFIRKARRIGQTSQLLIKSYHAEITERLNGIKDVKSNMLEQSRISWMQQWSEQIAQERIGRFKLSANSQLLYKLSSAVIIAAFVFISISMFKTQGAQLFIVIIIFSRLWPLVTGIQSNLEQLSASIPAFHALLDLQQACKEAKELDDGAFDNPGEPLNVRVGIDCKGVMFRYHQDSIHYALHQIDLHIPVNRTTAIVGPSGAGKSTLVDILMGLLTPEQGQVLIDGVPLSSDQLLSYRRSISYVSQDPFLFNATIRENLQLVKPEADDVSMWEALTFASAADFVNKLPHGLDTIVGDRGVRLSGGERQRIVLARAILRKPSVLVLDEATSALDADNELSIQEALERIGGKMTVIMIAHRLSTIRCADCIVVMERGRIVQTGSYVELADKDGLFRQLLNHQMLNTETA